MSGEEVQEQRVFSTWELPYVEDGVNPEVPEAVNGTIPPPEDSIVDTRGRGLR